MYTLCNTLPLPLHGAQSAFRYVTRCWAHAFIGQVILAGVLAMGQWCYSQPSVCTGYVTALWLGQMSDLLMGSPATGWKLASLLVGRHMYFVSLIPLLLYTRYQVVKGQGGQISCLSHGRRIIPVPYIGHYWSTQKVKVKVNILVSSEVLTQPSFPRECTFSGRT